MKNPPPFTPVIFSLLFLLLPLLTGNAAATYPDPLLEAQLLAIEVSGQLRPPPELTEQILNDLADIRTAFPQIADITYWPTAAPDKIIIGLTQQAFDDFKNGQYHVLDELNSTYGVIKITSFSLIKAILLKFNQVYNTQLLSQIYLHAHPYGVRYVEPNYSIGDGSNISASPPFYNFVRAWGDCPSGCIYHQWWHFKVEDGQVQQISITPEPSVRLVPDNYRNIQYAIDEAVNGDTVIIFPDIYKGRGNRDINFKGKKITVRSIDPNDPNIVAVTIVNCNGTETEPHRGFYFYSHDDANSVLSGLTIKNGYADKGGAVYCCMESSPTINNCTITNNTAEWEGGGIYSPYRSSPTITNCKITDNLAGYSGGGIYARGGYLTITNCIIKGNKSWEGGGICSSGPGWLQISNCAIAANSAEWGGGIFFEHNNSTITNCTFAQNSAPNGNALCGPWPSSIQLTNSILWDGGSEIWNDNDSTINVTYSDVQDGWLGQGNINADPCFVQPGYWDPNGTPADSNDDFWVEGDYHLLAGSPCINAGDPNYIPEPNETDLDGRPRVLLGRIDMGAYELFNRLPVANAGPNQTVSASPDCTAEVTLDGSDSNDPDGDPLTFLWTWKIDDQTYEANGVSPTIELPSGQHAIQLIISDGISESEPDEVVITVLDNTPPELTLSVTPTTLWPPNRQMIKVTPTWTLTDNCDPSPEVSLVDITCNEKIVKGNGITTGDIQVRNDGSIYLKAERAGTGLGRIYTITYQAVDAAGNTATSSATVTVPHDQAGSK